MARLRDKLVDNAAPPRGHFLTEEQRKRLAELERSGADHSELWAKFDEIRARIPDDAWDDIPPDLSINLDHYLYGSPKKEH